MARQKSRRGKGEGSIYYDKKNDRWVGSFHTQDGKRRYVYGKTEAEAREKLRAAQYAEKQGILATGPQQTVKQFLEYWLEEVHKPAIRTSSYVHYRALLDKHIFPALGHIRVQRLTIQQVESFYAQLAKKGLSSKAYEIFMACCVKLWLMQSISIWYRAMCAISLKSPCREKRNTNFTF